MEGGDGVVEVEFDGGEMEGGFIEDGDGLVEGARGEEEGVEGLEGSVEMG